MGADVRRVGGRAVAGRGGRDSWERIRAVAGARESDLYRDYIGQRDCAIDTRPHGSTTTSTRHLLLQKWRPSSKLLDFDDWYHPYPRRTIDELDDFPHHQ